MHDSGRKCIYVSGGPVREKNYSFPDQRSFIGMKDLQSYRRFAFKDDMLKLSVGFMIGAAFNKVVQGISDYLVMPVVNFMVSATNGEWRELRLEPLPGLVFEVGMLAGVFVDFAMVSVVLYLLYVRLIGGLMRRDEDAGRVQKRCPYCFSLIHAEARKCPMCCTGGLIVDKRGPGKKDKGAKGP